MVNALMICPSELLRFNKEHKIKKREQSVLSERSLFLSVRLFTALLWFIVPFWLIVTECVNAKRVLIISSGTIFTMSGLIFSDYSTSVGFSKNGHMWVFMHSSLIFRI